MNILMLLTGVQLPSLGEAFNLSCPSQAHWKLRAKSTCKPAKNYTCLYDVTFQVNVYREKCHRPRILAEGYRYVFQPNLNRATCRLNRYQPFIFDTIGNSDCIFLKSFCKSEGQTKYENGNTTSDRTCICDTKKGYTFVKNEGNQSYCNPSHEDCSCYVDIHPNNGTVELTDFNCYGEMNSNGSCSQGDALYKSQAFTNHEFDNFNYNLALPTNEYRTKTIMCVLISLFSYLHVVGIYILKRMKIQKTNSNQETKSQHTEPKTEKITPIALPEVITRLKDEDKDTYIKLMQSEKQERRYFVRIMIVGREKTGKTCLMRRLIKESIDDVTSTDGLDIVVRKCKINIHDGSWKIKANIYDDKIDRLQRAIIQSENVEKESSISDENMKNTYESTQFSENIPKQRTTSKPGDSVPIIDNKSVDETGEQNINHHTNMSTSKNIENVIGGIVNDNENSTIADKNGILKVNEDKDISAPLVMPKDLMSSVLSTTSNSDISTNNHALCGLWDFAGQKEFYATHQAFLSSNAIYLLVANIADDISQKAVKQYFADFDKVGDYVDFWFDTIHCHQTVNPGGYASCNEYSDPPVIVVFTGKDEYEKLNNGKKTVAERITELQNELNNVLKKQTKYHHLRNTFCLSNTDDPDEEFEKLRLEISALARQMNHWGELMPLKWILLEHLIEINKNEGMNFINFSDMLSMANHSDIQMVNIKDVKAFLHFQTKEGNIIFFDDIQDFIILNPQWLVEAFRCLVSDRMDPKLQHRSDWGDFKDNGRISESLIREFFKSKGGKHFIDQTKDLLKVMEKFDILIKIDATNSYIMPSMMPSGGFHEVCKQIGVEGADCKRTSWLCLKFEFLPPAFFTHFYLWFIRKYKPIYKDNEKPLWKYLFRGFCVFDIDKSNCKKLLVAMSTDTISLQLLSFSATEEDLGSICSDIRAGIIDHTNAITKRYDLKISFELHFKCSKSKFDEESIAYEVLKNMPEYRCENHTHLTKELYLPWMADEGEPGNPGISRFHGPVGPPGFPGSKGGKGEPARNGVGIKGTKEEPGLTGFPGQVEAPSRDIFFNKPSIGQAAKYKDSKLDTAEEKEQSIKMIKVSNIPTGSSKDSIRIFFENKRKSGGGDIWDLGYDEDSHTAIITFEAEDVAQRVISRMPLMFNKKKISVEIFVPLLSAPDVEEDEQASWNKETADMPTEFVIEVWGMKTTTSEETIRHYFESRRVADADVLKMEFNKEKGIYKIWFEEEKAIEVVMSKSRLRVDGQIINVNRYVTPPLPKLVPKYDDLAFITDICSTTLELGLEGNLIHEEQIREDTLVERLSEEQVSFLEVKLMKLKETFDVEIVFNRETGCIKVRGLIENRLEAMKEVHRIIRDIHRIRQKQQQQQQHTKLEADMGQWYYMSKVHTEQKLKDYPAEINLLIEQAFKNNEPQAFYLDNRGNKYIVDFKTFEEFPEQDPSHIVAIVRNYKLTDSGFDMPSNWAAMDQNKNIKIVTLQPADKEYQDVVKDFQTNMAGNYNSIVTIKKIQNRSLHKQYVAKKKSMDSTNTTGSNNERNLWHGTAMESVNYINKYGFNRSYCGKNALAYGNGVYFAVNPTYSAQAQCARPGPYGNKMMYRCKVLVGEFAKGEDGMTLPPTKSEAAGGHILYDSVVDNPQSPGIFVIFHDIQAYPEYLIVFK